MNKTMSKKLNIVVLVLITILVLYFSLKDNFKEVVYQIMNMKYVYLLFAFACLFTFYIFN